MLYLYHGQDEFTRAEAVHALRATLLAGDLADLNLVQLDGRNLSLSELRNNCDAIPFLGERRVVIVEGLLARLDPRRATSATGDGESGDEIPAEAAADPALKEGLLSYLPRVPATTCLVLVERKALTKNNAALKYLEALKGQAEVHRFEPPRAEDMPDWILKRVEQKGGQMDFSAANELAVHVGDDLRALDNELEKLLAYRAGGKIRREDVQVMVAPVQEAVIFDLVDAIGALKTELALKLLHEQLGHNAAPPYLLTMIERQFRLLTQLRDLQARGQSADQARQQLGLHPFAARKLWDQARRFSLPQLTEILHQLLAADLAIKTGRSEAELALDVLVIELTRMRVAP